MLNIPKNAYSYRLRVIGKSKDAKFGFFPVHGKSPYFLNETPLNSLQDIINIGKEAFDDFIEEHELKEEYYSTRGVVFYDKSGQEIDFFLNTQLVGNCNCETCQRSIKFDKILVLSDISREDFDFMEELYSHLQNTEEDLDWINSEREEQNETDD